MTRTPAQQAARDQRWARANQLIDQEVARLEAGCSGAGESNATWARIYLGIAGRAALAGDWADVRECAGEVYECLTPQPLYGWVCRLEGAARAARSHVLAGALHARLLAPKPPAQRRALLASPILLPLGTRWALRLWLAWYLSGAATLAARVRVQLLKGWYRLTLWPVPPRQQIANRLALARLDAAMLRLRVIYRLGRMPSAWAAWLACCAVICTQGTSARGTWAVWRVVWGLAPWQADRHARARYLLAWLKARSVK